MQLPQTINQISLPAQIIVTKCLHGCRENTVDEKRFPESRYLPNTTNIQLDTLIKTNFKTQTLSTNYKTSCLLLKKEKLQKKKKTVKICFT